jgi:hypothetical protein
MAELIATGETPDLIKPFSITRFYEDRLVGEKPPPCRTEPEGAI